MSRRQKTEGGMDIFTPFRIIPAGVIPFRDKSLTGFNAPLGFESQRLEFPTGFTPLESPAACSGDEPRKTSGLLRGEDIIPFLLWKIFERTFWLGVPKNFN